MDEKYYSCFKNDLDKIIVVRDQLQSRIQDQYNYPSNYPKTEEAPINSHLNRDQIKRVSSTQAPRNPVWLYINKYINYINEAFRIIDHCSLMTFFPFFIDLNSPCLIIMAIALPTIFSGKFILDVKLAIDI